MREGYAKSRTRKTSAKPTNYQNRTLGRACAVEHSSFRLGLVRSQEFHCVNSTLNQPFLGFKRAMPSIPPEDCILWQATNTALRAPR